MDDDPVPELGWVAPEVAEEHPDLALLEADVPGGPHRSPPEVRDRLEALSDAFRGAQAMVMRTKPIPWAYRVFFRHVGLDPDEHRTPLEALAVERLHAGRFRSHGMPRDALTIATLETGIPVWALDADRVHGRLGIRLAVRDEHAGGLRLPRGRLVVADERGPVAPLFGDPLERVVSPATTRLRLFALRVGGVPPLHVDEAFWVAAQLADG